MSGQTVLLEKLSSVSLNLMAGMPWTSWSEARVNSSGLSRKVRAGSRRAAYLQRSVE